MGKFLMVGIILLIVASLANMFFQIPALSLALSGAAVLLFSGFILYDVSRIVNGGETNYVMATLALYLDIYNLFVNLLQILMSLDAGTNKAYTYSVIRADGFLVTDNAFFQFLLVGKGSKRASRQHGGGGGQLFQKFPAGRCVIFRHIHKS